MLMEIPVDILLPEKWWQRVRYRLKEDVEFMGYTLPAGFVSDGATVPRLLWFAFPPVDRYLLATFLHDWMLTKGAGWKASNKAFRRALDHLSIAAPRKFLMGSLTRGYGLIKVYLFGDKP